MMKLGKDIVDSQLMVNWWFGFGVFGLLASPKMQGIAMKRAPLESQTTVWDKPPGMHKTVWDKPPINWCKSLPINSSTLLPFGRYTVDYLFASSTLTLNDLNVFFLAKAITWYSMPEKHIESQYHELNTKNYLQLMMTVWASPAIHQSGRCGRRFGGPPPQVPRRARRRLRGRPVAQPGDQPWPNPQIFVGNWILLRSCLHKLGICHLYISFSLFIDCCIDSRWYDVCAYVTFYQSPLPIILNFFHPATHPFP